MTETQLPVVEMQPYLWGDPRHRAELPEAARAALAALNVQPPPAPVDPADADLPPSTLAPAVLAALRAELGAEHVQSDPLARVAHTRGWSTPDLLRLRGGDASDAPDAVVLPGSHEDVLRVLQVCTEHRVAVVPFAGGTSVVGGLVAERAGFAGVIALDLRRLDALVALDAESHTATVQAGMRGTRAEQLLGEHGFTLGHFPQSYEGASIGGYAAARSAGQSSAGYGRFDDMVVGLRVATPRGTITLGTAPRSAAGPDLRQLVLGSEGAFGVITEVTVRVRPVPRQRLFEGWRFASFAEGVAALRALAHHGTLPTVLRLSDEAETAINLADPAKMGSGTSGCLAVVGYEGDPDEVGARRAAATRVLTAAGGEPLGPEPGEAWRTGRFHAPYLRDPLLAAGALVETLETATFWSNLVRLRAAVSDALTAALGEQGTPALVLCHVSHVYETGASLYFTVLCAQGPDPLSQWANAKAAANAAIGQCGATISHHHGVGTDHRAAYAQEVGPLAVDVLHAVKASLDPAGILNPGVLVTPTKSSLRPPSARAPE